MAEGCEEKLFSVIYVTRPNWKTFDFKLDLDDIDYYISEPIYDYFPLEQDPQRHVIYDRNVQFVIVPQEPGTRNNCLTMCEDIVNRLKEYLTLKMDVIDPQQVGVNVCLYSVRKLGYLNTTHAYVKEYDQCYL